MGTDQQLSSRFYFLCVEDRVARYEEILNDSVPKISVFTNVKDLLTQCVQEPPLGVLIDMGTNLHVGIMEMVPVYNLDVSWPVLRCRPAKDGGRVMCVDPPRNGGMLQTLAEIAEGDETWNNTQFARKFIRLNLRGRIRVRPKDHDTWYLGNIMDIGAGGCFVVTYEKFENGQDIEIEFLDLTDQEFSTTARIEWNRSWEKSTDTLPGIGITFDVQNLHPEIRKALANNLGRFIERLRQARHLQAGVSSAGPSL